MPISLRYQRMNSLLVGTPLFVRTEQFGQGKKDVGLLATVEGRNAGAVWGREYTHEAGHLLGGFPFELIMGVEGGFQARGVGRLLLRSLSIWSNRPRQKTRFRSRYTKIMLEPRSSMSR
jgi:hypothetical protein